MSSKSNQNIKRAHLFFPLMTYPESVTPVFQHLLNADSKSIVIVVSLNSDMTNDLLV